MSRNWIRNSLGAAAIVVALIATMGEGSSSKTSSGSDGTAASGSSAAAVSTAASPIPMGTAVTVAKGWEVKVNSAQLNADAELKAANMFNTPDPGSQFVTINVSVTNNSGKPASPFTNVKFSILPTTGVAIDDSFAAGVANEFSSTAQMQPGATATGVLVYEVPSAQIAGAVLLGEPVMTLDTAKDQRFFAIQ